MERLETAKLAGLSTTKFVPLKRDCKKLCGKIAFCETVFLRQNQVEVFSRAICCFLRQFLREAETYRRNQ